LDAISLISAGKDANRHCERSEAIQGRAADSGSLRRLRLLAMTGQSL
jgi:hypothetical protein